MERNHTEENSVFQLNTVPVILDTHRAEIGESVHTSGVDREKEITYGLIKEMKHDNAKERSQQSMTYWSCESCRQRKLL